MASYQDIDTRLKVIEDKVAFILKSFTVTRQEQSILDPSKVLVTTQTLGDVYRELTSRGAIIAPFPASKEQVDPKVEENGTDAAVTE